MNPHEAQTAILSHLQMDHADRLQRENATLRETLENERKFLAASREVYSEAMSRLAALEAEAKQAREDEAWFSRQHEATVYKVVLGWLVECDGGRVESGAIADGIRALRANVEGGAR